MPLSRATSQSDVLSLSEISSDSQMAQKKAFSQPLEIMNLNPSNAAAEELKRAKLAVPLGVGGWCWWLHTPLSVL